MADITIKDKKRTQFLVVNDDESITQVLLENKADNVLIDDLADNFVSEDVEGALAELAGRVASAGKVDDVRNNASDVSTSIVTNKIADLSKAVVKEAGKVTNILSFAEKEESASIYNRKCTYDGSVETVVGFQKGDLAIVEFNNDSPTKNIGIGLPSTGVTAGTYQGLTVDAKGRVTAAEDKGYAVKSNVDTELAKKLDKSGGSVTGNLTIGGNLTVNGTTTSIDSTTLKVSDKLIEVAKDNTVKLTTPAGIVVPNYDGRKYGALVIDGDGNAQVGDVELDASGNIDVTNSDLQILATRDGLTDGNLVKWDNTKKTLIPDTTVASNASSALSKANANATEISTIKTTYQTKTDNTLKTTDKTVAGAINEVKDTADSALSKANANATEISNLKNGTTKAKKAETADKVAYKLTVGNGTTSVQFDGSAAKNVTLGTSDFSVSETSGTLSVGLSNTGVKAGTYTALAVNAKGRVTDGGRAIAFIGKDDPIPSDVMVNGLIFRAKA